MSTTTRDEEIARTLARIDELEHQIRDWEDDLREIREARPGAPPATGELLAIVGIKKRECEVATRTLQVHLLRKGSINP